MSHYLMANYQWYERDREVEQVVRWGTELDRLYPDCRLVAVGQSAAWMVHVAGEIRRRQSRPENCTIIPFSGNFMNRAHRPGARYPENTWSSDFTPDESKPWPKPEHRRQYFNHLAAQGCRPAQIAADHRDGLKTVFVDMAETARGIASFMTLYCQEARQDGVKTTLLQAASFYIYDSFGTLDQAAVTLRDPEGEAYDVPVTARVLNSEERFTMKLVAGGNALDAKSSRLAPYYNLTSRNPEPQEAGNQALQNTIRASLDSALQKHLSPAL